MAGLSLGEYTALCAAGVLDFEDCLRLVKTRGEAMQRAAALAGEFVRDRTGGYQQVPLGKRGGKPAVVGVQTDRGRSLGANRPDELRQQSTSPNHILDDRG